MCAQLAALRAAGTEVLVVSSGAVGLGMGRLGLKSRPAETALKQACAAVGQSLLMQTWQAAFEPHEITVAQVLLTHDDLRSRARYLGVKDTLARVLGYGAVPIINENDAVSAVEIKETGRGFGDNDTLSAMVAALVGAQFLLILSTAPGLVDLRGTGKVVPVVERITPEIEAMAGGTTSETAVGGMKSKIEAAKIVIRSGIPLVIASGKKKNALVKVANGEDEGTLFVAPPTKMQGRKRWIAFFHHPKGTLFVDNGAKKALRENGKSLLPPGVSRCEGEFASADVVRICDLDGMEFARGIAKFSAREIRTEKLARVVLVHRDDLVIL
jgi:glutamate 5-kinase